MGLRDRLSDSLKQAMKAKDAKRVSTLRLVFAAIKDRDLATRLEAPQTGISDDEILSLLAKMVKQREESAATYDSGGRPELAAGEREEIAIILEFMPRRLSSEETRAAAQQAIADIGAASSKDMGKVMAALRERYAGSMDFGKAGAVVKELLATAKS